MSAGTNDWIANGLTSAARIMLGEGASARDFTGTRAAIRASFLGLAMALVMDAGIVSLGQPEGGRLQVFTWLLVLDLSAYAAAIAMILVLTREPQQRARFPAYFEAQNWGEAVLAAAFIVPKWIYVSMPPVRVDGAQVTGSPLITIVIVVGIVVASFIARYRLLLHVLGTSGVRAFWMVIAAVAASALVTAVLA